MSSRPSPFTSARVTPVVQDPSLFRRPASSVTSRKRNFPSFKYSRVPPWLRSEHDLGQAVAVQVPDRHPATVVEVAIGEDVQVVGLGEAILESDPGVAGGEQREQGAAGGRRRGGPGGA